MTDTMRAADVEGYPGGRYPDRRHIGQFNALQVAGFTVVPADQANTNRYFGLRHTDTFVDGLFHGADGAFSVYVHNLSSGADGNMRYSEFPIGGLRATADGMVPEPGTGVGAGPVDVAQELTGDGRLVYSIRGDADREAVSIGDTDIEWTSERGQLRVSGAQCGQGTQWHHAWRRPDDQTGEMLYCHQGYDVEGTYRGEPVRGLVIIETMWGNEHYLDTWFVRNRVGSWGSFGNVYDDGTSEYGQFLVGEYGATGAVVTDDAGRETLCTNNARVTHGDGADLHYEFGNGERWEFAADPRTVSRFGEGDESTVLAFGTCQRVDEPRSIVSSTCTCFVARRLPEPMAFS